jgi:hypothetical protein
MGAEKAADDFGIQIVGCLQGQANGNGSHAAKKSRQVKKQQSRDEPGSVVL